MKPKANRLWFGDNGRILCTDHLGCSAATTGRDISGQRIAMVRVDDYRALEANAEMRGRLSTSDILTCEDARCTRHATAMDAGDGGAAVSVIRQSERCARCGRAGRKLSRRRGSPKGDRLCAACKRALDRIRARVKADWP